MRDPHGDLIPPATFLYIAERLGLIQKIDRWVTARAINLSGHTIGDAGLLELIERRLGETGVSPERLVFEVRRDRRHRRRRPHHRLRPAARRAGLQVRARRLRRQPWLLLPPQAPAVRLPQVDGEFVRRCAESETDRILISAVVQIAHGMRKRTIAEHVEDQETVEVLTRLGVDHAQGFHLGRHPANRIAGLPVSTRRGSTSAPTGSPRARTGACLNAPGTSEKRLAPLPARDPVVLRARGVPQRHRCPRVCAEPQPRGQLRAGLGRDRPHRLIDPDRITAVRAQPPHKGHRRIRASSRPCHSDAIRNPPRRPAGDYGHGRLPAQSATFGPKRYRRPAPESAFRYSGRAGQRRAKAAAASPAAAGARQGHRCQWAFQTPFQSPAHSNPCSEPKRSGIIVRVSGVRVPSSGMRGACISALSLELGHAELFRVPAALFGSSPCRGAARADNCVPSRVPQDRPQSAR